MDEVQAAEDKPSAKSACSSTQHCYSTFNQHPAARQSSRTCMCFAACSQAEHRHSLHAHTAQMKACVHNYLVVATMEIRTESACSNCARLLVPSSL